MKKKIFIQANEKQFIGAKVAEYSFQKKMSDQSIEVELMMAENSPLLLSKSGQLHLRKGVKTKWKNDLQNFTTLRFMPPELMEYTGRALVVDPDVFALVDVAQLFEMDMNGKAILARKIYSDDADYWASSVMLLDCSKLTHWVWAKDFEKIFTYERDYRSWMNLDYEDQVAIGELDQKWNDYDHLDSETCMLHTTSRRTQPWKTGLPIDFSISEKKRPKGFFSQVLFQLGLKIDSNEPQQGLYLPHPDKNQEIFFYQLLKEAIDLKRISKREIEEAIKMKNVRPDSFEIMKTI